MRNTIIALGLALASLPCYATPRTATGSASFLAVGKPSFVKIHGDGGPVTCGGAEDAAGVITGVCTVNTGKLTTGMGIRDEHMHTKYLGTGDATLTIKPWQKTTSPSPFAGDLTIKGQTKAVTGTASVSADGKLHAELKLSIKDYPAIGVPSFDGITVADEVTVTVDAEVK